MTDNVLPQSIHDDMIAIRRDLHKHPELSWNEIETAKRLTAFLDRYGIAYDAGIAKTGIVATLPGETEGPFVAIRADMDALPIQEETGLPFTSSVDGVMHACGHDGHMTMALGAAALLSQASSLPLPVRIIFQPAEEVAEGAKAMVEAGVLKDVVAIFGGHLDRNYPVGSIVLHDGAVNASSDLFRIDVHGDSSHGARPQEGVDALVCASAIVTALQTLVSREIDPGQPAVVTVGRFESGTAANIVPGMAMLEGTIRSHDPDVRAQLHHSVKRLAEHVAEAHGARAVVTLTKRAPALLNDSALLATAREAALSVVGADKVLPMSSINMGAEDFSCYLSETPGCYVRFGGAYPDRENFPAHSSRWDFDEGVLAVGAAYFAAVAVQVGSEYSL